MQEGYIPLDLLYEAAYDIDGEDGENTAQDLILNGGIDVIEGEEEPLIFIRDAYIIMHKIASEDGENHLQGLLIDYYKLDMPDEDDEDYFDDFDYLEDEEDYFYEYEEYDDDDDYDF